jgi:hypothetical protein
MPPDDIDSFFSQKANASAGAAQGVTPQAGLTALKSAPLVNVDPSVGMHDPEGVQAQAQTEGNAAILAASPPLQGFVSSSPAKAAAVGNDFGSLAGLANTVSTWNANITGRMEHDFEEPARAAYAAAGIDTARQQAAIKSGDLAATLKAGGSRVGDALALAFSPVSGVFNSVIDPVAGAAASVAPYASGAFRGASVNDPIARTSPELAKEYYKSLFNTVLMFAGAGRNPFDAEAGIGAAGAARPTPPESPLPSLPAPGEIPRAGTGHPAADAIHTMEANTTAQGVQDMENAVGKVSTHAQAPELTQDFLANHTPAGEATAWVSPDKVAELWHNGDQVFQDHAADFARAMETGADVPVPMSTYLSEVSGKPFADELRNSTRFSEDGVSVDQANELAAKSAPEKAEGFDLAQSNDQAFVAKPNTVDTNAIAAMLPTAEQFGGRYAVGRANTAFQFPTAEAREAFMAETGKQGLAPDFEQSVGPAVERRATERTPEQEAAFHAEVQPTNEPLREQGNFELASADTPTGRVYVAKPKTTDPAEVEKLLPSAERNGGRYAMGRAKTAFQFRTPEARDAFLREQGGVPKTEPKVPEGTEPEFHQPIRELAAKVDQVVDQVFKENGLDTLFTEPKAAGMTKGLFERYGAAVDEARAAVHESLMEKTYAQIKKERSPDWKAAVDLHMEEALTALNKQPNIVAYRALRDPMFKIDRDSVPEDLVLPDAIIKRGGLSPDEAAELAGYPSGKALLADMHALNVAVQAHGGTLNDYIKNRARVYAEEKARAMVGYDVSPEGLLSAAREAVGDPKIEDLLISSLRAVGERLGLPLTKAAVQEAAEGDFERLPLKAATKPKDFAANMKRLGDKAEAAILDGKDLDAFRHKQHQLIQFHELKMAFALQKEFAKASRSFATVAKKPISAKMDQTARNHLRGILQDMGVPVTSGKYEDARTALRGQTLDQYDDAVRALGKPLYISPITAKLKGMTVTQFNDAWNMWQSISDHGRDEMSVYTNGKKYSLEAKVAEVKANANAVGRPYTATREQLSKGTVQLAKIFEPRQFELLSRKITNAPERLALSIGAAGVRNETALFWLDRETHGPLMELIVTPLNQRAGWKLQRIQELSRDFRAMVATQSKGWIKSLDDKVDIPELTYGKDEGGSPIPWIRDKSMVISAALHMGTESNFAKLTEGYGWDPATTRQAIFANLTPEDWKYVQFLWDQAYKLWPETQALYRATVGLAAKEIPGVKFETPDGLKLQGRYWPLEYDWNALGEQADENGQSVDVKDPMALGNSDLFGPQYRVATPPNRSQKARTQFVGPLNLDHSTVHQQFEAVIHDLAFRKELIQAAKLLRQPAVALAIRESLGPQYLTATKQWLQDIAKQSNYDQTALKGLAGYFRGIRKRFTIVQIGFNVATVVKHAGIAAFHMMGEGGLELPGAVKDLMTNGDHWTKFIDANSSEVPNTLFNLDRDVREAMEDTLRKTGLITTWQYYSTALFSIIKRAEAQATWLAKYREQVSKGVDDTTAFALADKSVRDTQGSGTTVNLAALQRGDGSLGSEAIKLFNAFTTFMNTQTNRMWTVGRRNARMVQRIKNAVGGGGRGGGGGGNGVPIGPPEDEGWAGARRDFVKNMADILFFSVLPATFLALLDIEIDNATGKHQKRFFQAIHDGFLAKFSEHETQGLLGGTIPGGNVISQVPKMLATGKFDAGNDPLSEMLASIAATGFDAVTAMEGKKVHDQKWPTHAIETAGYLSPFGPLPVKPAARAGQFWWDRDHGKTKDNGLLGLAIATAFGNAAVKEHPQTGEGGKHGSHHK